MNKILLLILSISMIGCCNCDNQRAINRCNELTRQVNTNTVAFENLCDALHRGGYITLEDKKLVLKDMTK